MYSLQAVARGAVNIFFLHNSMVHLQSRANDSHRTAFEAAQANQV
jgi:hypothetical protein